MNMISRYNRKWVKPKHKSCPVKEEYELVTIIEPISFNEDKTIKEYKEITKYVCKKSKWRDYIKSFDIGSPSEQIMNHLQKGTPLVTAHTLPAGDYTQKNLLKSAEIVREMQAKGITLDMIESALKSSENGGSVKTTGENPTPEEGK